MIDILLIKQDLNNKFVSGSQTVKLDSVAIQQITEIWKNPNYPVLLISDLKVKFQKLDVNPSFNTNYINVINTGNNSNLTFSSIRKIAKNFT